MMTKWTMAAAALAAGAAAGQVPFAPFADVPNVTFAPYEVAGRDAGAIRRSIDQNRPTDSNDGQRVDALTRWHFQWRVRRDALGICSTTSEDVTFSAVVTVPHLADSAVPDGMRARFDRYYQSLLAHEDGHARYAWEHRGDVVAAINAAGCDGVAAAGHAAVAAIAAHDAAYDRATRHGATTIIPFS